MSEKPFIVDFFDYIKWIKIDASTYSLKTRLAMQEWCQENVKEGEYDHADYVFRFKHEHDAIMFKLALL